MFRQLGKLVKSTIKLQTLKETVFLFKLKKKTRKKAINPIMITFTYIGSAGLVWVVPALYLMRRKRTRFDGLLLLTGIGFDVVVNNIITKLLFHRKRPWFNYPEEYLRNSLSLGYSFPSGHTLTSSTAATILYLIDRKNSIWVIPLTGMIAFSRLYLFAHYPSDVLFGLIDGMISGDLIYRIGNRWKKEGKLGFLNPLLNNNYLFEYKNVLSPIKYSKNLFKTGFKCLKILLLDI